MMNKYLTGKGAYPRWWEIPAAILSALLGAVGVEVLIEDIAENGLGFADVAAYAMLFPLLVGPLFLVGLRMARRVKARRLAAALERQAGDAIPLDKLDRTLGMTGAAERIRRLTAKGYLQRLILDSENGCLWLFNPGRPRPAAPEGEADQTSVLTRIRALNDAIDDPEVSGRIDRVEALTAGILETVREHPERAEEVRRFANYYLPVTLKLLESYRLMEKQSYQGENIQASREKIEQALEKLVRAIEQQQDRLFRADALDVDAEIRVLETLMRGEG